MRIENRNRIEIELRILIVLEKKRNQKQHKTDKLGGNSKKTEKYISSSIEVHNFIATPFFFCN